MSAPGKPLLGRPMLRLAFAGGTGLFLELAVIRWAGAHVLYLSYVANFVLLGAFLGLGAGCLLAGRVGASRVARLTNCGPALLALLVLAVALLEVEVVIEGQQVVYFANERLQGAQIPAWLALPLLGAVVLALFGTIGTAVGSEIDRAPRLVAYSCEIGGSLAGIALFALVSFLQLPATIWLAVAGVALLLLGTRRRPLLALNAALVLAAAWTCAWVDSGSRWSPYYRVSVTQTGRAPARTPTDPAAGTPIHRLRVNSITHQYISDIHRREPFYEFPYRAYGAHHVGRHRRYLVDPRPTAGVPPPPHPARVLRRVLIVGAGTGTDVAFALAYGARHVDAVEIDPVLAELGRALHPNRPYADARVALHVGDARNFLERAGGPYDLIVFGLPDSLTLATPYAGLRLESFLFTRETFARVRQLLSPDHGLFVAYNYYRHPWLVRRIARTIGAGFGQPPRVLVGPDRNLSAAFFAGPAAPSVMAGLGASWGFRWFEPAAASRATHAAVPVDDWPFLYLKRRTVPRHLALAMAGFVLFAALLIGALIRATRRFTAPAAGRRFRLLELAPFFLMGAAFLLLETAGLVRMALLFGTTWFVNALVFFAVLAMVLLANLIAARRPLRRPAPLFAVLVAALLLAWWLPPAAFATWPAVARYGAAATVLFVPILLANLVFSRAFREARDPALAFGANLVGAVLGGALEYLSLVLGYRALFLVGLALYVAAFVATLAAERRRPVEQA